MKFHGFWLLAVFLFVGCDFGFLNTPLNLGTSPDSTPTIPLIVSDTNMTDANGIIRTYTRSEVVQNIEKILYADDDISRSYPLRLQSLTPQNLVLWSVRYSYDDQNRVQIKAYYSYDNSLSSFEVLEYHPGTANLLKAKYQYSKESVFQTAQYYEYNNEDSKKVSLSAVFVADDQTVFKLKSAIATEWDASSRVARVLTYGGEYLQKEVSTEYDAFDYGLVDDDLITIDKTTTFVLSRALGADAPAEEAQPEIVVSPLVALLAETPLPALPTTPELVMPTLVNTGTKTQNSVYLKETDQYGTTEISLRGDWYPLSVIRTDENLNRPVTIDLTYDPASPQRIVRKLTRFGEIDVLDVSVAYNDVGYPSKVTTKGKGLLLPSEYTLTYDDSNTYLNKIVVSSNNFAIMSFQYSYLPGLGAVEAVAPGIDLFGFAKNVHVISQNEGDTDKVMAWYVFIPDVAGKNLKVEVRTPNPEASNDFTQGLPNGYFLVSYDETGRSTKLESYTAEGVGTVLFEYSYNQFLKDSAGIVGTISEISPIDIPAELTDPAQIEAKAIELFENLVKGFLYDMLIN